MINKYYKAFDKNLQCRGMQYEIDKEYTFDGKPIHCKQGFHYCKSIADCYKFYNRSEDTRICEVEPLGDIATDDELKFCTNKIKIVAEIENPRLRSNLSESSSGYCNSGDWNSGNWNSGNRNSGNRNSGNWNSGNWNSGNKNSGDWNSGNRNSGNWNSGNWNSGDWNSGNWNSGDWNSGDWNSGVFCTEKKPTIRLFDAETDWTYNDWYNSIAYDVMANCPYTHSNFIHKSNMSDEEKEDHPEHKTIGGYIKTFVVTKEEKQRWWNDLCEDDKKAVMSLPNFDAHKFYLCTEIDCREVPN